MPTLPEHGLGRSHILQSQGTCPVIHTVRLLRVGQEANRHHGADQQSGQDHPEGGLFVIHHVPDSGLHPHLSESNRAGRDPAAVDTAVQQRRGIGPAIVRSHIANDFFITSRLNVPAQQDIGRPHHRIEPVNGKQKEPGRLPPVIMTADMGPLVGQHIGSVPLLQAEGQVDHRAENSQYKGGIHEFTLLDPLLQGYGSANPALQKQVAHQCVQKHHAHSHDPDPGTDKGQYLGRIGAGRFHRGQRGFQHGIHHFVQGGEAAVNLRPGRVENLLRKRLCGWDQAQSALQGKGADQPQGHQPPKQTGDPPGHSPEQNPHRHHRQCQPAGGDAHVHQL